MGDRVVALCNFCEIHGPRIVFSCQVTSSKKNGHTTKGRNSGLQFYGDVKRDLLDSHSTNHEDATFSSTADICDGCRSFNRSKPAYLTNDHAKRRSFIGCQYPYRVDLFSKVRASCVRSLSCEACPGRQGSIIFGDADNGYCLCYVFTLKDSKARGFQHSYSIIIVTQQLDELIRNYSPLVVLLKTTVSRLQAWSNSVFDREGSESNDRMPQIAASGRASWMPSGFFLRSSGTGGPCRSIAAPRSLKELTDRMDIFEILHETFVDVHCLASTSIPYELDRRNSSIDTIGQESAESIECRHICTACETLSSPTIAFRTLTLLYDVLGSEPFSILIYHLLIGDQVVVRSSNACLNRILLDAFKLLLPSGCIKCVDSSRIYLEPWKCNLVGLIVDHICPDDIAQNGGNDCHSIRKITPVPSNSTGEEACVILCAESSIDPPPLGRRNGKSHSKQHSKERGVSWESYRFRMFCTAAAASNKIFDSNSPSPSLLNSLLNLLSTSFSKLYTSEDGTVAGLRCLDSLKIDWLRRAKLYYVVSKRCDGDQDAWRRLFFRISKCTTVDEPILKFWIGGLSRRFKQCILAQYVGHSSHEKNGNLVH